MKIKAAVVYEKDGPYKIEEVDLADPKENEVLVKVIASGICHTDDVAPHAADTGSAAGCPGARRMRCG